MRDVEGEWLVKFRHLYDPQDMGLSEFQYNQVARDCGIIVPDIKQNRAVLIYRRENDCRSRTQM